MVERCGLPRHIELGGKGYKLSPPTVRQAVEILYVIKHRNSAADDELLMELVCALDWKPVPLGLRASFVSDPEQFCRLMQLAIWQGYSLPDDFTDKSKGDKLSSDKPKGYDWEQALTSYCATYGGDPWSVWNTTPFPFFLQKMNSWKRDNAMRQMQRAQAANPGKKTIEAWQAAIRGGKPEPDERDMLFERLTPEEVEKEKELARKQYFKK